jgi:uncharacterized membrane protein YcaP (DUF421 family)
LKAPIAIAIGVFSFVRRFFCAQGTVALTAPFRPVADLGDFRGGIAMLDGLLGTMGHVTWTQECVRGLLVFLYGLVVLRIAGRRVFGKWSALDFIVSIMIGSNLSRALTGNAPLWGTLAATTLLLVLHWLLARAAAHSTRLSRLLEGHAIPLGRGGKVDVSALRRHGVSGADVDQALRAAGLEAASGTRLVVLEPSGRISVLRADVASAKEQQIRANR